MGSLKRSLGNGDIKINKVRYINSFKDVIDEIEPPFYFREDKSGLHINKRLQQVYKFIPYSYECEVRALYVDISKEPGKAFSIDINELIHEVYVSPFASGWFVDLVKRVSLEK